jgi:hypothetical protein
LRILAAGLVAASLAGGCAGKGPAVFDKPAIDDIRALAVPPLQSPQDPSAGPLVSGMIAVRLQSARLPKLSVVEPPVLWRLQEGARQAVTDEAAMRIAREMGADAVLTGTVTYGVRFVADRTTPRAMRESMKARDFQRDFGARKATASVSLRILSVKANRAVYAHTGTAGGAEGSELLVKAVQAALKPFQDYVRTSR